MCPWLAPNANRIATSRARPALRASESPVMLDTAMRRTNNTAPVNIHSAVRVRAPVTYTLNGTTLMPRDADPGDDSSMCRAIALISACACSTDDPARSLPTTNHGPAPRALRSASQLEYNVCGSHTSASSSSGGRIPMTRDGSLSSTRVAPTASSDPPKRVCQNLWLISASRCRSPASSAVNVRPCVGCTPISEK